MFALSVKYQDKEKIIQINNEYIPVLPTEWKDRFNVSITVGLGTGTKEQQVVMLNNILQKQLQAFELQGRRDYPMVTMKNIYNTLSKIIENAGLQTVGSYFIDPIKGQKLMSPPPPPEITPIEKIEMARIDAENKRKIADIELRYKELEQKHQDTLLDFEAKIKDIALKYNTQLDTTKLKAEAELDRVIIAKGSKNLELAEKSANMFTEQFENKNGQQRPRQEAQGIEQIISGETDITE
jgi:DNA-directed RNA polymerase beta' subunit